MKLEELKIYFSISITLAFRDYKKIAKSKWYFNENWKTLSYGFTLAETLLTLTIIGVLAALTVPNLITTHQEASWKASWKTIYSNLSQAYLTVKRKNGGTLVEFFNGAEDEDIRTPFIEEFNRIVSEGPSINYSAIDNSNFTNYIIEYKDLTGNRIEHHNFAYGNLEFANGMHLYFRTPDGSYKTFWVDVNGAYKGPNVLGKDLFVATLTKDWIRPTGAPGTHPNVNCEAINDTCGGYGFHSPTYCAGAGCSAKYLYSK